MAAPQITDPLGRQLYERLEELGTSRMVQLASGAATQLVNSATSTAENYAAHVSYLKAVADIQELIVELDHVRYSSQKMSGED